MIPTMATDFTLKERLISRVLSQKASKSHTVRTLLKKIAVPRLYFNVFRDLCGFASKGEIGSGSSNTMVSCYLSLELRLRKASQASPLPSSRNALPSVLATSAPALRAPFETFDKTSMRTEIQRTSVDIIDSILTSKS